MKIQGSITMLFSEDGLKIELHDNNASIRFLDISLPASKTCQAFSRLAQVPCEIELRAIENIGKTMELKTLSFPLPENADYHNYKQAAKEAIKNYLPDGWKSDDYFNSQDSFFEKDKKPMARCTI